MHTAQQFKAFSFSPLLTPHSCCTCLAPYALATLNFSLVPRYKWVCYSKVRFWTNLQNQDHFKSSFTTFNNLIHGEGFKCQMLTIRCGVSGGASLKRHVPWVPSHQGGEGKTCFSFLSSQEERVSRGLLDKFDMSPSS